MIALAIFVLTYTISGSFIPAIAYWLIIVGNLIFIATIFDHNTPAILLGILLSFIGGILLGQIIWAIAVSFAILLSLIAFYFLAIVFKF